MKATYPRNDEILETELEQSARENNNYKGPDGAEVVEWVSNGTKSAGFEEHGLRISS